MSLHKRPGGVLLTSHGNLGACQMWELLGRWPGVCCTGAPTACPRDRRPKRLRLRGSPGSLGRASQRRPLQPALSFLSSGSTYGRENVKETALRCRGLCSELGNSVALGFLQEQKSVMARFFLKIYYLRRPIS